MKRRANLIRIANNRPITKGDADFLHQYQNSVLLALKQAGMLTEMQYRHGEESLKMQRRMTHGG